jgi:uncharacterized membrane protein YhiD involved in acid resistance
MGDLFNFYNLTVTEISAALIVFNILLSFVLQLTIVWVYKKTHQGLSYSESFLFTLVMIGVLGTVIMMVVQGNLIGAFALLGAFSLIRFRTIVKETRDVAFVFFALSTGVAVGTNNYSIALISTFAISLIVFVMWKYGWGVRSDKNDLGYVLTMNTSGELNIDSLKNTIMESSSLYELLHAKYREGQGGHYAFSVHFDDNSELHVLEGKLKKLDNVKSLEFITSKHSVEY